MSIPYDSSIFNSPINSSPPPPYAVAPRSAPHPRMPYNHESRETTSLVNPSKGGDHAKCNCKCKIHRWFPLLFIFMVVSLCLIVPMVSSFVRSEMIEWERVHDNMLRDIGRLREEKGEILDEVQQIRADRDERRREWELEREEHEKRRRGHVPFWGEARLVTAQCPSDRFRRYEARMHNLLVEDDWFEACMKEPIEIAGQRLASPDSCTNEGLDRGVYGYWSLEVNTRECPRTIWDKLRNIFRSLLQWMPF